MPIDDDNDMFVDVVNGIKPLDISHARGELEDLAKVHDSFFKW